MMIMAIIVDDGNTDNDHQDNYQIIIMMTMISNLVRLVG